MMDCVLRGLLGAVAGALAEVPSNKHAFTYTITGRLDSTPYLTRTLLPRLGDRRLMLHQIHRPDADPYCHNHPWRWANFLIASGGYVEERLEYDDDGPKKVISEYRVGDVNRLTNHAFHRIVEILPNTWTIGLIGPRVQSWGFMVDGELVDFREYFKQAGHAPAVGSMS